MSRAIGRLLLLLLLLLSYAATFLGPTAARSRARTRLRASGATQTVLDALKEFDGKFEEPFELLGLDDPECPKPEIRAAFRKVARVEHPDVSDKEDAEERFRRISLAYELLIDDGGRAMLLEAQRFEIWVLWEVDGLRNGLVLALNGGRTPCKTLPKLPPVGHVGPGEGRR